jgi:hypothetical protein
VLSWLRAHTVPAHKRPDVVRAFLREHRDDSRFADEVALLTPIMEGAGILYVVDGAKPYGEEYEAEMEILRWTGQPSMALINTIGEGDYTAEWERALGQYFKLIRRYDPMRARFDDHIEILEAIAQLHQEWVAPVKRSIERYRHAHAERIARTAHIIARLVARATGHVESIAYAGEAPTSDEREMLVRRYQEALRSFESDAQRSVEALWNHTHLDKEQSTLVFEEMDLFSRQSASLFGMSRQEMVIAGAAGGAATGAGIDLLFAGHTLLLGGVIGAIAGGAGAWWGFDELSEIRVLGTTLGTRKIEMGPMANRNFPWILLGRALYHAHTLIGRSHAVRDAVRLEADERFKDRWLDASLQSTLEKGHKAFRSGEEPSVEMMARYEKAILQGLERLTSRSS